jgi:prevent-host-death family protein
MVLGLLNQGVSMRTEVDISELENHTDELLERVEKGETIVITLRGEPIVNLVPHGVEDPSG